jgi:predicted nucleic acid-binding protein
MAPKIFLDTNILLDFLLKRQGELEEIKSIFNAGVDKSLDIYVSESVLTTTIYFLQKQNIDALAVARELMPDLFILPLTKGIFSYPIETFKDTEDGILYFIALDHKLDYFITRNTDDFKNHLEDLPVLTPSLFITTIFLPE